LRMFLAGIGLLIDGNQTHQLHKPTNTPLVL
jgi:hypothetical protein